MTIRHIQLIINFLVLFISCFLTLSCHKQDDGLPLPIERFQNALDSTILDCKGIYDSLYTSFFIDDNKQACYSHGQDGYLIQGRITTLYVTTAPVLTVGNTETPGKIGFQLRADHDLKNYTEIFFIQSPMWGTDHTRIETYDKFLVPGTYPVRDRFKSDSTAFDIGFVLFFDVPDFKHGYGFVPFVEVASRFGQQDGNSYVTIEKVTKHETDGKVTYDAELSFQCLLYASDPNLPMHRYYGRLTKGKMVIKIDPAK